MTHNEHRKNVQWANCEQVGENFYKENFLVKAVSGERYVSYST